MDIQAEIRKILETYGTGSLSMSGPDNAAMRCPFHSKSDGSLERSPSFAMNIATGLYLCHSCGAKGNLFTFFRDIGVPRDEIRFKYQHLIDAAKNNLPAAADPRTAQLIDKHPVDHRVLGLLDYCPNDLLRAGFTEETLQSFEVGFDRWHMRTTYPIRDIAGQLVAISGRAIDADNYPRYKIYNKEYAVWGLPPRENWERSNVLYNAWRLYADLYHARTPAEIILVEGFKACMWVHQAGLTSVSALLGHYLTQPQRWILDGLGGTIYMFLDNNWQGWHGCEQAALQLAHGTDVRVILYPERLKDDDDAQPDSCTVEEIREQKARAIDFWAFRALRRQLHRETNTLRDPHIERRRTS